jgi:predicted dehydrogenase
MAKQWRAAVIGAGLVGDWHVRVLPKLAETKLVAVCDADVSRANASLAKHQVSGVPVYQTTAEMYRKEELDSVHICTPSGSHLEIAGEAMALGKSIVCEKPLEISTERVDQMIEEAKRRSVRIAGIFQNRWNEANRTIRSATESGRFGRLTWAGSFTPWYRPDKYYAPGGWRGTWKMDGGGAVMNQGIHQIDLLQWIMGPVKRVSAYAASRIHDTIEVEDTMSCALEFANGAFGTFVSTTAMWPGSPTRLEVGGEKGTAVSENGLKRFEFAEKQPADADLLERLNPAKATNSGGGKSAGDAGVDLHSLNIGSIYRAWNEGKEAETWGPEARKAVAIVQAMYESVRGGGTSVAVR